MANTPRLDTVSPKRQRIAELARQAPEMVFTSLAHHIDRDVLHAAYVATRKDGAVGLDGQTADCTAPGSLDTHLCYAAWRSSYSSRASIGV